MIHQGGNEIYSSEANNNELDMTKEIKERFHPNAMPLRLPTKESLTPPNQMSFNPNDISEIPINNDLIRSEEETSGTFIGTLDLKEALGFMGSKSNRNVNKSDVAGDKNSPKFEKSPKISINPIISPNLIDPFSPRNIMVQTKLSSQLKNKENMQNNNVNQKKIEFPSRDISFNINFRY